jgi:DNA-binding NarL/FixJ family response regulator
MMADDHVLMREGIKHLLENEGSIEIVGEACDGEECLEKLETVKPQVLLLDINMPKMNGIGVLEEMKKRNSNVKVLVLTIHSDFDYLFAAIEEYDVNGYILKDTDSAELITAIKTVASGEKYIQPKLVALMDKKSETRDNDKYKIDSLTSREMEVLIEVANGLFNKEIATSLNISERTVKNHVSNIFKKIEVSDRTQAAVFAIKNDIVRLF